MFIATVFIVFFLYLVNNFRFRWKNADKIKLAQKLNVGYISYPVIGHSYMFIGNAQSLMATFQTFGRIALQNGGATSMWAMSDLFVLLSDPEMAEVVLKKCLEKHEMITNVVRLMTGNGSGFAPVKTWRYRRKLIAPTFSSKLMIKNVSVFAAKNEVMRKQLQTMAGKGNFPIWSYINAYSMDSVCESTMGVTVNAQTETKRAKVLNVLCYLLQRGGTEMCRPWVNNTVVLKLLYLVPFYRNGMRIIEEFINEIIKTKRQELKENQIDSDQLNKNDDCLKPFLDLFIESTTLTNKELLEETKVMLVAGTDTTAVSISFTIAMLARHPDIQNKVYQELLEVFGDSQRAVDAEDMKRLKYLEMVIKESLRLYPPAPMIVRKTEEDVEIRPGLTVPKGCGVLINIWAIHRNPKYWGSDAEIFRPERFINETPEHPVAYLPFSYGPRGCLGYRYAMYSLKCTLASILREYQILPPTESHNVFQTIQTSRTSFTDPRPLQLTFEIMMKDKEQFVVQLEERNKAQ